MLDNVEGLGETRGAIAQKPRANALSPEMLARVIYQPSFLYFRVAAEELSVRSASRKLGVASSAITRQIAQLENALGLDLFNRVSQRLSLTPAGRILLHHTRQVLRPLEAAISDLEGLRRRAANSVSVAFVESVGFSLASDLLSGFGQSHPCFKICVTLDSSSRVLSRLSVNEADIGITMFVAVPAGLQVVLEHTLPFGAVLSPGHPLAQNKTISIADLAKHPCAFVVDGLADEVGLSSLLTQERTDHFHPLVQANSVQLPIGLARLGKYVAVTTPFPVREELARGTLLFRPFADPEVARVRIGLFVRQDASLSPAVTAFLSYVTSYLRETLPVHDTPGIKADPDPPSFPWSPRGKA